MEPEEHEENVPLLGRNNNTMTGAVWTFILSVLLFWLPLIGYAVAGFVGGRKAGSPGRGFVAVLIPSITIFIMGAIILGIQGGIAPIAEVSGSFETAGKDIFPGFFTLLETLDLNAAGNAVSILIPFGLIGGLIAQQNSREIEYLSYRTKQDHREEWSRSGYLPFAPSNNREDDGRSASPKIALVERVKGAFAVEGRRRDTDGDRQPLVLPSHALLADGRGWLEQGRNGTWAVRQTVEPGTGGVHMDTDGWGHSLYNHTRHPLDDIPAIGGRGGRRATHSRSDRPSYLSSDPERVDGPLALLPGRTDNGYTRSSNPSWSRAPDKEDTPSWRPRLADHPLLSSVPPMMRDMVPKEQGRASNGMLWDTRFEDEMASRIVAEGSSFEPNRVSSKDLRRMLKGKRSDRPVREPEPVPSHPWERRGRAWDGDSVGRYPGAGDGRYPGRETVQPLIFSR